MAQNIKIDVADKPDSQDLCFIGKEGYRDFLEKYGTAHTASGLIRATTGNIVGKHNGLFNYTIGQRKGVGSGFSIPHYVIKKDIACNELIIGTEEELGTNIILVGSVNWVQKNSIDESNILFS